MKNIVLLLFGLSILPRALFAQHSDESIHIQMLNLYQDTLTDLGQKFINNDNDLERKNANYKFIKTLVSALKVPNSFLFPFDSVKSVTIVNSPDNRFRLITWHIMNDDGSYRFYGTIQINTGGKLEIYPLEDYSPLIKSPEDTITSNRTWFGAQYYKMVFVNADKPYYVLLGWKGYTVQSTKKVIEALSFQNGKPVFGMPVFDGGGKKRDRVVFQYARQASMLLRYVPEENMIVFDHLSSPDKKSQNKPEMFGPDLSYDGYKLKYNKWELVENLDMRNVPDAHDANFVDPKKQALIDRAAASEKPTGN